MNEIDASWFFAAVASKSEKKQKYIIRMNWSYAEFQFCVWFHMKFSFDWIHIRYDLIWLNSIEFNSIRWIDDSYHIKHTYAPNKWEEGRGRVCVIERKIRRKLWWWWCWCYRCGGGGGGNVRVNMCICFSIWLLWQRENLRAGDLLRL